MRWKTRSWGREKEDIAQSAKALAGTSCTRLGSRTHFVVFGAVVDLNLINMDRNRQSPFFAIHLLPTILLSDLPSDPPPLRHSPCLQQLRPSHVGAKWRARGGEGGVRAKREGCSVGKVIKAFCPSLRSLFISTPDLKYNHLSFISSLASQTTLDLCGLDGGQETVTSFATPSFHFTKASFSFDLSSAAFHWLTSSSRDSLSDLTRCGEFVDAHDLTKFVKLRRVELLADGASALPEDERAGLLESVASRLSAQPNMCGGVSDLKLSNPGEDLPLNWVAEHAILSHVPSSIVYLDLADIPLYSSYLLSFLRTANTPSLRRITLALGALRLCDTGGEDGMMEVLEECERKEVRVGWGARDFEQQLREAVTGGKEERDD